MPNYEAMRVEMPKLKSALTRAKNSGDPAKVLQAVERAINAFDAFGWPDNWATWKIALGDAFFSFRRSDAYESDLYENHGVLAERFAIASDSFR
jgi:hypothetical protein